MNCSKGLLLLLKRVIREIKYSSYIFTGRKKIRCNFQCEIKKRNILIFNDVAFCVCGPSWA